MSTMAHSEKSNSKKRKLHVAKGSTNASKKARTDDPPSPIVLLPHNPDGTVPSNDEKKGKQENLSEKGEDRSRVINGTSPGRDMLDLAVEEHSSKGKGRRRSENKRRPKDKSVKRVEHEFNQRDTEMTDFRTADNADPLDLDEEDAEEAEALGDDRLDREVELLDRNALIQQADAEALAMALPGYREPTWRLSEPSGGRFFGCDPIFMSDPSTGEDVIITATESAVLVLSVATSLPIRTFIAPRGHSVISLALDPSQSGRLNGISRGLDHRTSLLTVNWTSEDAQVSIGSDLKHEHVALARSDGSGDGSNLAIRRAGSKYQIVRGNTTLYRVANILLNLQVLGDDEFVVAYGPAVLVIGKAGEEQAFEWLEFTHVESITCLDARLTHTVEQAKKKPQQRQPHLSIAIGTSSGQIHLYEGVASLFAPRRSLTATLNLPLPRTLHWHREAVSAVKFSRDGNYLISGGRETVLVIWQLQTGVKQFLPHLGSEIERIAVSPRGDRYVLQLGDNSIMALSTSELKPVAYFAGLQLSTRMQAEHATMSTMARKATAAAVIGHPRNRHQVLLTVPSTEPRSSTPAALARPFLQTFDLRTTRSVSRQALTRNNVTDLNVGPDKTPIASPDVHLLAVSHDGQWLASVDEWMPPASDVAFLANNDGSIEEERRKRREVYLKIWRWDEEKRLWSLNTRVDGPHKRASGGGRTVMGCGRVISLLADPVARGFVTAGEEGCIKIWRPRTRRKRGAVKKIEGEEEVTVEWVCRRTVELPDAVPAKAELPDSPVDDHAADSLTLQRACMAFSNDGSILAVALAFPGAFTTAPLVHFIDPSTGNILTSKTNRANNAVQALAFLNRYLIVAADGRALIWDLVTDSLQQDFIIPRGGEPLIAVSESEGNFAVAVSEKISVFQPKSNQALWKGQCEKNVAALLVKGQHERGYTILCEDATVRTLAATGVGARPKVSADVEATLEVTDAAQNVDAGELEAGAEIEMQDLLALPDPASVDSAAQQGLVIDRAEDDRSVVRPEQLASIFDVPQSYAMPSVRDMFAAVTDLFARKPLPRPEADLMAVVT